MFLQSVIVRALAPLTIWVIAGWPPSPAGPVWAKAAVPLPLGCADSKDVQALQSPDGATRLEVRCGGGNPAGTGVTLHVSTRGRLPLDVAIALDTVSVWRPQEVLWAPDSSAFVINGSESAYAGDDFVLYDIASGQPTTKRITSAAQTDMSRTFPPCEAANFSVADCHEFAGHPEFNMSAIAWTHDSRALIVFAEVPCSSTFGDIMCQVMGYEIELPTGRILTRMSALELKSRYQSQANWDIKIPAKPRYAR